MFSYFDQCLYLSFSCSWRVRIALEMKSIPYEYHAVHLVKDGGQQHSASYKTLNPSREVPTLEIDGKILAQSLAIIEYLEETRPESVSGVRLLPEDAGERANVRRVSDMIASSIQAVQNLRVLQYVMGMYENPEEKTKQKLEWGRHWIASGFEALETVLESTSGTYCVGDTVSMADCCLVPQVYNARRFKVDMSKFPIICRIESELAKIPAFQRAKLSVQPDAQ